MRVHCGMLAAILVVAVFGTVGRGAEPPLSAERRAALRKGFDETITRMTRQIKESPKNIAFYSRRGDARMFLGRFKQSVADYEKMITLKPKIEVQHWRLGLAYFYVGKYKQSARLFQLYDRFDHVDRESGIWYFLAQAKVVGIKKARTTMIRYEKTDREPFPSLYKMFQGTMKPDAVLREIKQADLKPPQRSARLFYAHLYIGLYDVILNKPQSALKHLRIATASEWAQQRQGGPIYMWQVARLHYNLLSAAAKKKNPSPAKPKR